MQKNIDTEDFDLYVKESLQDAEETPSPRVWEALAARLAAGAAPSEGAVAPAASAGSSRGFRWGWVALAAAAALAAVLVIPHNSNLSTIPNEREVLAQAATVSVGDIPAPAAIGALTARSQSVASLQKQQKMTASPVSEEGIPSNSAAGQPAAATAAEPAVATAAEQPSATAAEPASEPAADPFALMAYEDSRSAAERKPARSSVWLGGNVGGNEAQSGGAAYGAKSSNPDYIENSIVENTASNYGIPLSVGAGVRVGLTEMLSASVGVDYSYLSRSFTGTYTPSGSLPTFGEINHSMRYIGIPVGLYCNLVTKGSVGFYLFGVGEAEWCVGNSYDIAGTTVSEKVSGTQFSAGGGFGVEFRLSPLLSLYVDPAVRYYFPSGHPNNIRSEKGLMLNFNAGLRFNL